MAVSETNFLSIGILALAIHLFIYLVALRRRLRTEVAIFLFHLVPTLTMFVCSVIFVLISMTEERVASAITLISTNGIYSLTFLELWSLSQISYSREVLVKVKSGHLLSISSYTDELAAIGDKKRTERLIALCNMGLLSRTKDVYGLSMRGIFIAKALQLLNWLPNLKSRG
jgi:hypothetical protein